MCGQRNAHACWLGVRRWDGGDCRAGRTPRSLPRAGQRPAAFRRKEWGWRGRRGCTGARPLPAQEALCGLAPAHERRPWGRGRRGAHRKILSPDRAHRRRRPKSAWRRRSERRRPAGRYFRHVQRHTGDAVFLPPREDFKGEHRYERLVRNLVQALKDEAILIVLDNFETNLKEHPQPGGGEPAYACKDKAWDDCLARLSHELDGTPSRVLITCRRPLAPLAGTAPLPRLAPLPAAQPAPLPPPPPAPHPLPPPLAH